MKDDGDASSLPLLGLDTNVLLRYLVADDPEQHKQAAFIIEHVCSREYPGLLHPVALCEVVWALRQVYKVPKADIVHALTLLLRVDSLRVLNESVVVRALNVYKNNSVDFADALLHSAYRDNGGGLATFDRAASRLPGATLVSNRPK